MSISRSEKPTVPKYELVPRGMTALLDAVGRAINETGERLAKMDEADRPGLVVFVVMTDGLENSSKEFSKATIKEMIERQQQKRLQPYLRCSRRPFCRGLDRSSSEEKDVAAVSEGP